MYAARRKEDGDVTDIIAGTFTVNYVPYFALIDIGLNHPYVSCFMADKLGIEVEDTVSNVAILSPLGQSISINIVCKRCPLEIQREVFLADLMELRFNKFDLILGMDWLVKHQVISDCTTKRVSSKTLVGKEIVMVGEHSDRGLCADQD